jgi:hypothetical protein
MADDARAHTSDDTAAEEPPGARLRILTYLLGSIRTIRPGHRSDDFDYCSM